MSTPILEYYYKCDELNDPMVNKFHIKAMNWATEDELAQIEKAGLKINSIMTDYLKTKNIDLIDFKLEFGRYHGKVLLGDEISPDNCRFWDSTTHEKLDKDRFRRDLGHVEDAYKEILHRLTGKQV